MRVAPMRSVSEFSPPYTTRAVLLATFDDDLQFVEELVATFLSRCPILIEEILTGFHAADAGAVSRAAHTLKGSLGYFETGEVYEAAHQLERITAAELRRVPALVSVLQERLAELTRYLNAEFSS